LLAYLFRGRADVLRKNLNNFLIVPSGKIGDLVCATPLYLAVRKNYPAAKIIDLGNKINRDVLLDSGLADEYITKKNFWPLLKEIKKQKIDFACLIEINFEVLAVLYLAGLPLISILKIKNGYCPYETRPYRILGKFVVNSPYYMERYAAREYLKLLEPIGIFTDDTKKHLSFSQEADKRINDFLVKNNIKKDFDFIVGIAPSAGNKIKVWGGEKFAKVAGYLYQKYKAKIIIIGGNDDEKEAKEMIACLEKNVEIINTANMFNIDELKALISEMNLLISVDSGPIYIADAFDVPTIDIVGPMSEKEQPPSGEKHRIVKAERKKPELHIMNARVYDKKEARRQVDDITAEMVINELDDLMKIIYG